MIEWSKTRNFAKVQDFHSSGREVLYSFVCEPFPDNLDAYITQEAKILASKTASIAYGSRYPSGDGQHQQWHIKEETAYAFLTETHTEFQPTYASAQAEFNILWPLSLHFLERPIPVSGHVRSNTGVPLAASIQVTQAPNVFWKSSPTHGAYHLFLPDGQYTVTFSATNHIATTRNIAVSNNVPSVNLDVILQRI